MVYAYNSDKAIRPHQPKDRVDSMGEQQNQMSQWLDRDTAVEAIRQLGEDDLVFLNDQIIDRLKLLAQARSTVELARFSVGDRVGFQGKDGRPCEGVIIRLNKKTASITTDDGRRWNVSPQLLRPLAR